MIQVTHRRKSDGRTDGTKWRKQAIGISVREMRGKRKEGKEGLKIGGDQFAGWFPRHGRKKRWRPDGVLLPVEVAKLAREGSGGMKKEKEGWEADGR